MSRNIVESNGEILILSFNEKNKEQITRGVTLNGSYFRNIRTPTRIEAAKCFRKPK
jgi:hypothetical protein